MKANNSIRIVVGTALLLMVPLVAMLFTDEVNWNWFDFAVIATLLIGTGLAFELLTTKINPKYRTMTAVVLLAIMLLVGVELAVGVIGSPIAGS